MSPSVQHWEGWARYHSCLTPSIPFYSRRLCPIPVLGRLACIITVLSCILRSKILRYYRLVIIDHLWLTVYALSLKPSPALSYVHTLVRLATAERTKIHASELWPIGASRITTMKSNRYTIIKCNCNGGIILSIHLPVGRPSPEQCSIIFCPHPIS